MALITTVAGAYVGVFTASTLAGGASSQSVGILSDEGYRFAWTIHAQSIGNDGTDRFGQTLLTNIWRGADWVMQIRAREWSEAAVDLAWPYSSIVDADADDALAPHMGSPTTAAPPEIGQDAWNRHCSSLVLTAVAGTPAATAGPATITIGKLAAMPGQHSSFELTSKNRELPMAFQLLPYSATVNAVTYYTWFVTT